MKKLVLGVALASLVISCKKIQAGSNHAILKMEEGTERYTDDHMHGEPMGSKPTAEKAEKDSSTVTGHAESAKKDSAKVEKPASTH